MLPPSKCHLHVHGPRAMAVGQDTSMPKPLETPLGMLFVSNFPLPDAKRCPIRSHPLSVCHGYTSSPFSDSRGCRLLGYTGLE